MYSSRLQNLLSPGAPVASRLATDVGNGQNGAVHLIRRCPVNHAGRLNRRVGASSAARRVPSSRARRSRRRRRWILSGPGLDSGRGRRGRAGAPFLRRARPRRRPLSRGRSPRGAAVALGSRRPGRAGGEPIRLPARWRRRGPAVRRGCEGSAAARASGTLLHMTRPYIAPPSPGLKRSLPSVTPPSFAAFGAPSHSATASLPRHGWPRRGLRGRAGRRR